jgi:hypothetical protein
MRQIDVREDGAARDCGEDGHDQDDDASRDAGQHRGFAKAAAGEQDDGARRGSGDESGFDQEAGREKVRGQDAGCLVSVESPGKDEEACERERDAREVHPQKPCPVLNVRDREKDQRKRRRKRDRSGPPPELDGEESRDEEHEDEDHGARVQELKSEDLHGQDQQVVGDGSVGIHDAREGLRVWPRRRALRDPRQRVQDVAFFVVGLKGCGDRKNGDDPHDAMQGEGRERELENDGRAMFHARLRSLRRVWLRARHGAPGGSRISRSGRG